MNPKIVLVGNANVGKTSVYNSITHSNDHVGNWHGVTVSAASKEILYRHTKLVVEDLPGIYSLSVDAGEEVVSRDEILKQDYDTVINVCEVNNLPRNLYLTMQLLELDLPVVVAINMVDELKKLGKSINYRYIERILGVPVIPVSAKFHSDIHLLLDVVLDQGGMRSANPTLLNYLDGLPLDEIEAIIEPNAKAAGLTNLRWLAIKVMDGDSVVLSQLDLSSAQKQALTRFGDMQERIASARYSKIDEITMFAVTPSVVDEHHEMHEHEIHAVPLERCYGGDSTVDERTADKRRRSHVRHHNLHKQRKYMHGYSAVDRILLNKYLALPIFFAIMAAIFALTFGLLGKLMSDGLEWLLVNGVSQPIDRWLVSIHTPTWVTALVVDGVIGGVGGILTFVPQITLLFLFLSLLEDSGYMSRIAFMTDGFFRKVGLSGKSAFTMLMGFGCSATAVLTANNLEDENVKIKTVLLTPFMSCSARLPVFATLGGLFFGAQPFVIFGLYLMGVAAALVWAAILHRVKKLKSESVNFIMEMPPYRFPTLGRVFKLVWANLKAFLIRVGSLIFAVNVIVWLLSNMSITQGYVSDGNGSIMSYVAGFLAPLFKPLGFGNWQAVTALISGFVAKEIVVTTLQSFGSIGDIFYNSGASAFSFLVFVLLYIPCVATIGTVSKQIGRKWAWINVAMQMGTAYIVSLACYWIGRLFAILSPGAIAAIVILTIVAVVVIAVIVTAVKRRNLCFGCGLSGVCGGSCAKRPHKKDRDKRPCDK